MSRHFAVLLFALSALLSRPARADDDALGRAKALFQEGVRLFSGGDLAGAFNRFSRSRALFPSVENTLNAAISANHLKRFDVALGLYDALVAEFRGDLAPPDRGAVSRAISALLHEVGSLEIAANVAGTVYVDGEAKEMLPQLGPLRLLPGTHSVRIVKGGYATYERDLEVEADQRRRIDARLEPLGGMGELRVEDTDTPGSELYVDGRMVGTTPWEGALAPGRHVLYARKGEVGSAPERFTILQGQAALRRVRARPLGPTVHLLLKPEEALVSIDGAPVGRGRWDGRLPVGTYTLTLEAPGYVVKQAELRVLPATSPEMHAVYKLEVDASSSQWLSSKDPDRSRWFVGASLGFPFILGSSLTFCDTGCLTERYTRAFAAIRGGFRIRGLGLEVEGGALSLPVGGTSRYWALYLGGGLSFRMPITNELAVVPRITVGKAFNLQTSPDATDADSDSTLLLRAELGPELDIGGARLSLAVGLTAVQKVTTLGPQVGIEWGF